MKNEITIRFSYLEGGIVAEEVDKDNKLKFFSKRKIYPCTNLPLDSIVCSAIADFVYKIMPEGAKVYNEELEIETKIVSAKVIISTDFIDS